jgi:flagellar basal body-associated protein FliL
MADESIFETRTKKHFEGGAWMAALMFVLIAALAGWIWYRSTSAQPAEAQSSESEVVTVLHLDSFVVNLSGASGNGYLRVGIDLGLGSELKEGAARTAYIARARDCILSVLGTRSVEELLTSAGKTRLKEDLAAAMRERVPEIRCHEVYFTEFLVQH